MRYRGFMASNLKALDHARQLDALGLNVLPAIPRDKRPAVKWEPYQTKRSTSQLAAWFGGAKQYNFWILCGEISRVAVLDCDNEEAEKLWRSKIGKEMDATTCVRTARGFHYWFRIDGPFESWAVKSDEGASFDVRADGSGVIAPPSIVQSAAAPDGHRYEWVRDMSALRPAPEALRKARETRKEKKKANARVGLSDLLSGPPDAAEKGNNWMTQVAGHYAKWIPFRDAFEATIRQVNDNLKYPIAEPDIAKLVESIWSTEHEKIAAPTEDAGWLRGNGHQLLTLVKRGDDEEWTEWANFDVVCKGVIHDENDYRSYVVSVQSVDRLPQDDLLEPDTIGSPPRLQIWLASHGVNIVPPLGDPRKGSSSARLQRYLESQEAPVSRAAPYLGFNTGHGFITHGGVIGASGLEPFSGVIPHPRLRGWAPYQYGFVSEDEAREVLNEVLTFQEEEICSIFGSWWAACFLKGLPEFGTSLWPYIALEAPSESGKTRGFFSLMIALTGNTEGHGESTTAALRDKVSAHRNGPVWIDDLSDVQAVSEILRQATSEGTRTKKGQDRHSQESVQLVAPIVVSGESMGSVLSEKAQRDRAIHLIAHSPTSRVSTRGAYPQWDDIQDLLAKYEGSLTRVAGSMVAMALSHTDQIRFFRELRGPAGRHNDKIGVLRVGARVLSRMTQDERHIRLVDGWCARQEDLGQENVLTTRVLPELMQGLIQSTAIGGPAVFVHNDIVHFSETKVAQEWESKHRFDRRAVSLGSLESIRAQRIALGILGDGKRIPTLSRRHATDLSGMRRYQTLTPELSKMVLDRAGMGVHSDVNSGVISMFTVDEEKGKDC